MISTLLKILKILKELLQKFLKRGSGAEPLVLVVDSLQYRHAHRGDVDADAVEEVALHGEGLHDAGVQHAAAAEAGVVGVEDFPIAPGQGNVDVVIHVSHGGEVEDHGHVPPLSGDTAECKDALLGVVGLQPLEGSFGGVGVLVPQSGGGEVEIIQSGEVVLKLGVELVVQEIPVQLPLLAPLGELADLAAHEPELGARQGHHPGGEGPRSREFLPVVSGHLVQEGLFEMHHLVVGDGEDVVFDEGVGGDVGDSAVVVAAEDGILLHVAQGIVHPAHVPLVGEA